MKFKRLLTSIATIASFAVLNGCLPINNSLCQDIFTVIWRNYDGEILQVDSDVACNYSPCFNGEVPSKPSTYFCEYIFNGWNVDIDFEQGIVIYTAQYIEQYLKRFSYTGATLGVGNTFGVENTHSFLGGQGGSSFGDFLFRFESDNTFGVYRISTKELIGSFTLNDSLTDLSLAPHCNCAFFGNQRYCQDDEFPTVYVNAYNNERLPWGTLYAFRITRQNDSFSSTLIQTINVGFINTDEWASTTSYVHRPQGNFILDSSENKLYAYLPRNDLNSTMFFEFNMPSLNSGTSVVLSIDDIADSFTTSFCLLPQDNCYYNNKLFICSGGTGSGFIRVLDLTNKQITSEIDLNANGFEWEPEFIDIIEGYLYCGQSELYKFYF